MTDAIRTPDVLLDGLPGFDWAPSFRQWDGLRLAHVSIGEGSPVVMVHGEPTWSYLWRKVAVPVRDAGHRVILPDLPGFGRSDKPMDERWYSYERHTAALAALVEDLDLRDATFVLHDWGGPIGLRVAVEHPERVSRLVLMDTGLFTGEQHMSDAWQPADPLRLERPGGAEHEALEDLARAFAEQGRAALLLRRNQAQAVAQVGHDCSTRAEDAKPRVLSLMARLMER